MKPKKNSIAKLSLESFEINLTVNIFACGGLFNGELELRKFLGPNVQPIRREKTLLSNVRLLRIWEPPPEIPYSIAFRISRHENSWHEQTLSFRLWWTKKLN